MRYSKLFTKTQRTPPKGEESKNAQLLIQAGYIHKEMAGVYSYLPLGLRVLNNVANIVREEMNALGAQELLLTTLQDPAVWKETGRWSDDVIDNWFKTKLKNEAELGVANTHEEPLTALLTNHVQSWRDLPLYVYQIQTKFRNELRAKSGIMRGREFLMKDMYSFSKSQEEFTEFYEQCAAAYLRIFDRLGLGERTFRTFASGGSFSKFSDEFQTVSEAGEDIVYLNREKNIGVNREVYTDEVLAELGFKKEELEEVKSIEVGNIFPLGTKYAEALGLAYQDKQGEKKPVVMGSYGIGVGRAMGTVAEVFADEKGLVWPMSIAPFHAYLISLGKTEEQAKELYNQLQKQGIEVLYDDREEASAGEKFADADLLGIPWRLVVSEKTLEKQEIELKNRQNKEPEYISLDSLPTFLKQQLD